VIDLVLALVVLAALVLGAFAGFVTIALGVGGFLVGVVVGSRIMEVVMDDSPWLPMATLLGALFLGAIVQGLGIRLATPIVRRLGPVRVADHVGGAAGGLVFGLGLVWLLAVVGLSQPAFGVRDRLQDSRIASRLVNAVSAEDVLGAIARFDPLPRLPGVTDVMLPPPDPSVSRSAAVAATGRGVVKIEGTSCGMGVQGSGWIAGDGLVVTNVHVVTGQSRTRILVPGGRVVRAAIVYADRANDVAVLRTPSLGAPALTVGDQPKAGASVSVLGYPNDGGLMAIPASIGAPARILTDDADENRRLRTIVPLRAAVRPGASGGPVIDARGRVVSMVFASTLDGDGGIAIPASVLDRALGAPLGGAIDPGRCAHGT
jgi:S1-C subfamily serine protease